MWLFANVAFPLGYKLHEGIHLSLWEEDLRDEYCVGVTLLSVGGSSRVARPFLFPYLRFCEWEEDTVSEVGSSLQCSHVSE